MGSLVNVTIEGDGDEVLVGHGSPYRVTSSQHKALTICLLCISVFGIISNGIICCVIAQAKLYCSSFHATLFVLHAGGWGIGFLGCMFSACALYTLKFALKEPLCTMYGFILAWQGIECILSISVIAFEWYRKLTSLRKYPRAKWHILCRVGTIWSLSFLVTCPPLFGWNRYTVEVYSLPCSVDWESTVLTDRLYVAFIFIFGLFAPLAVIIFSYGKICLITRKLAIRRMSECSFESTTVSHHHIALMRMLFVMFLAFCITWFPYGIHVLILAFGHKELLSAESAMGIMLLAKASACTYPILYAYMNHEIQRVLKTWKADLLEWFRSTRESFRHRQDSVYTWS